MKKIIIAVVVILGISSAYSEVNCTKEPVTLWKNKEVFQKELELTYKVKKFKVTPGNCYEIYGIDKAGKRVEIYFNPVSGEIVKQRN